MAKFTCLLDQLLVNFLVDYKQLKACRHFFNLEALKMRKDKYPHRHLGSTLKAFRAAAGLSQRDVAKKFGWTTAQFVSNWERGLVKPPPARLKRLAKLYGVTITEIVDHMAQEYRHRLLAAVS